MWKRLFFFLGLPCFFFSAIYIFYILHSKLPHVNIKPRLFCPFFVTSKIPHPNSPTPDIEICPRNIESSGHQVDVRMVNLFLRLIEVKSDGSPGTYHNVIECSVQLGNSILHSQRCVFPALRLPPSTTHLFELRIPFSFPVFSCFLLKGVTILHS